MNEDGLAALAISTALVNMAVDSVREMFTDPGARASAATLISGRINKVQKDANGIIIGESHVIRSEIIRTGIGITARAIVIQRCATHSGSL
jgi:hypothetical protein